MPKKQYKVDPGLLTLAGNVAHYRNIRGWTQLDLAVHSGIDKSDISRIESAFINVRYKTIVKLCDALGITPNDLHFPR